MVFMSYIVYNLVSEMIYTSSEVALKSEVRAVDGTTAGFVGRSLMHIKNDVAAWPSIGSRRANPR